MYTSLINLALGDDFALDDHALCDLEPVIGGQGDVRELELGLGSGRGRTPRQVAPERSTGVLPP